MKLLMSVKDRAKPESFVLIVILPDNAGPIRNAVKHWGDVTCGMSIIQLALLLNPEYYFRCNDTMLAAREVHGCQ